MTTSKREKLRLRFIVLLAIGVGITLWPALSKRGAVTEQLRFVVPVAAQVVKIDSMSAHADRGEILRWLRTLPHAPRLCLVHGESGPMSALPIRVKEQLGWDALMPTHGERIEI